MHLHNETADLSGIGGSVVSNAVAARNYQTSIATANEIASAIIAARFNLSPHLARLVCELASIGGRFA